MNAQNETWFTRNKESILGIAVAVLILNIVLFLFVPNASVVSFDAQTPAYDAGDASFSELHTLTLNGTRKAHVLKSDTFSGTISVDGSEPVELTLVRENGRWVGELPEQSPVRAIYSARDFSKLVLILAGDEDRFLAPDAQSARAAQLLLRSYRSE